MSDAESAYRSFLAAMLEGYHAANGPTTSFIPRIPVAVDAKDDELLVQALVRGHVVKVHGENYALTREGWKAATFGELR